MELSAKKKKKNSGSASGGVVFRASPPAPLLFYTRLPLLKSPVPVNDFYVRKIGIIFFWGRGGGEGREWRIMALEEKYSLGLSMCYVQLSRR